MESKLKIRDKVRFLEEAFREAQINLDSHEGGPFGAIIVDLDFNEIIGRGHNQVISMHDCTCHAEIMAIKNACKFRNSHLLNNTAIFTTSYPCPMCLGAIFWARINEIYYSGNSYDTKDIGFDDVKIYDFISRIANPINKITETLEKHLDPFSSNDEYSKYDDNNTIKEFKQLLPDMNKELLLDWGKQNNKIRY